MIRLPIIVSLLVVAVLAVPVSEASDDIETVINLYRTEGAAAALPKFKDLYFSSTEQGDLEVAAKANRYVGECHWRMGEFDLARRHLDEALLSMNSLGMRLEEGKVLNVLGLLEWDLGNYNQAISRFQSASQIGADLGNKRLAGSTMNNLSLVYDELGDYETSLKQYQLALQLYEGEDFPRGVSDTLGNIGGVNLLLGRYSEALDYYQRALEISEKLQSRASMSLDHGNLGLCHLGLGQIDQAVLHFDQAIEYSIEAGMPKEEALWKRGKGNALMQIGRYDEGLAYHRAALETYEQIEARGLLLDALNDMGHLHLTLGDPVSAETYFQRGIQLAGEIGHTRGVTINLIAMGDIRLRREQFEEADALYEQAFDRANQAGERIYQIQAALRLSAVHRNQARFSESEASANIALEAAREIGSVQGVAEAWFALAEAALLQEKADSALEFYAAAEMAQQESPNPQLQWQTHYGKARTYIIKGQSEEALSQLQAAVRIIEGVRERLKEDRFKAGYIQDKYRVYVDLVRLQLELGRTNDAFSTAERLRSRRFLNQLEKSGPVSRTESERKKEISLRERMRTLQKALEEEDALDPSERRQLAVDSFSSELLIAEREYQTFLDDLQGQSAIVQGASAPSSANVQGQLLQNEALLEYVVGEDEIVIFVLTGSGLSARRQELPYRDLQAKVTLVRELIQDAEEENWLGPAESLSDHLIAPVVADGLLDEVEHLYLVPHNILNYLPFSLLPLGREPDSLAMVDRFTLTYLPAAAALTQETRENDNNQSLLAMAPQRARLSPMPPYFLAGQQQRARSRRKPRITGYCTYRHTAISIRITHSCQALSSKLTTPMTAILRSTKYSG
jgi:tetratricopeptide (TPR) repeat protein